MAINPVGVPRRAAGYIHESIDGELLLYHPGRSTAVYLNETASLVWQLCDGRRSCAEVTVALTGAFPEARDEIRRDVIRAIERLAEHGALVFT